MKTQSICPSNSSTRHSSDESVFLAGCPVWLEGRGREKNLFVGFRAVFRVGAGKPATLRVAACSLYRAWCNGRFLAHGPARAAHGYFRVDAWELDGFLQDGENVLALELAGYNVPNFYVLDQPAFVQAEIVCDGAVLASTLGDGAGFDAFVLPDRVQKVPRYSKGQQRTFAEAYRLSADHALWRTDAQATVPAEPLARFPHKRLLPRGVAPPLFAVRQAVCCVAGGSVRSQPEPEDAWRPYTPKEENGRIDAGFPLEELDVMPAAELQRLGNAAVRKLNEPYEPDVGIPISPNDWRIFDFGVNLAGFVRVELEAAQPATVYVTFDEILSDGDVDFHRLGCMNAIRYELAPGSHALESFEPYTLRYLKVLALDGAVTLHGVQVREMACPDADRAQFSCSDGRLVDLFEAGRETFRQNAIDLFMDNPSRERAGWLGDGFFTARAEHVLRPDSAIERNFFENFLLPETFADLPEGMLPMCYPADHTDGTFIAGWALWFVLQLAEYLTRSGDADMVEALRARVEGVFDYLSAFENEDGLLEKLESWIFVEWSKANKFVQDVNYPTNMLYAGALEAAGRLYKREDWAARAGGLRTAILEQSFDGTFFVDNAVREDGRLVPTRNRSETCQYSAFFFDVATPETHSALWQKLVAEFGPRRRDQDPYPDVHPSAFLFGEVLRLDLLARFGCTGQALEETKAYCLHMADQTGTLWEHAAATAACSQGFASHVVHTICQAALGIERIDRRNRTVRIRFNDVPLAWCRGRIPVGHDAVEVSWRRDGDRLLYRASVPAGFSLEVQNLSGLKACPA